jgi:hypothetical protein
LSKLKEKLDDLIENCDTICSKCGSQDVRFSLTFRPWPACHESDYSWNVVCFGCFSEYEEKIHVLEV